MFEVEIVEKGTQEFHRLKEEFFVKFKISLDNEKLVQNILDLEHLLDHIRIMAKKVHKQIGKKRQETSIAFFSCLIIAVNFHGFCYESWMVLDAALLIQKPSEIGAREKSQVRTKE